MLARDQRAHLDAGLVARADLDLRNALLDRLDQRLRRVADRDDHRDRHAALARGAVAGRDRRVGRHVDVGVRQHDHVVLRAGERLAALPVRSRSRVDVLRDRRRADERDRRHVGMLEQRVDRDLVAVHDVEHAVGNARLVQQLREVHGRRRILLRRLEHERVPARDRRREHPHRHHRGEVERRDPADDTERLANRIHVDAGRRLLRVAALQQVRDPARELDDLEPARDLAERVRLDLAVLRGQEARDVLAMLVEQLAHAKQDLGAPPERRRPPRREGGLGDGDRLGDLLDGRKVDSAGLASGCGVVHGPVPVRLPCDRHSADPVVDRRDRGRSFGERVGHDTKRNVGRPAGESPKAPARRVRFSNAPAGSRVRAARPSSVATPRRGASRTPGARSGSGTASGRSRDRRARGATYASRPSRP